MVSYKSPAIRRYMIRIIALGLVYAILLIAAVTVFRFHHPSGPSAYALAILPALPVIGMIWAVMRLLVEEQDGYLRMLHVRQALFATGFSLTVMTFWEFLQNFDLVAPGNGGFGAAFFWLVGLGFGGLYNKLTLGTSAACA